MKQTRTLVLANALLLAALAGTGLCQLTAPQLLAPAVKEYGAEYKDVEEAIAEFKRGKFTEAREQLMAARKKNPELAPADVMMANLYLSVGRTRNARAAIERAVITHPEDPEAYILTADLALRNNQLTVADLGYDRGRRLIDNAAKNPHRQKNLGIRLRAGMASLAEARKQYDEAADHLAKWLTLDPDSPVAWGSLGRVEFHLKKYDEAKKAFAKLNELSKDAPTVEIAMGRLYSDAGMHKEARQYMEAAARQAGKDNRARLTVAEWALQRGLTDLAKQQIDAALKTDSSSISGLVLSARLARQTGDLARAEQILTQAVLRSPNNFSVTNELARTLAMSSDKKKLKTGLEYAKRNFQIHQSRLETSVGREATMTFAWLLHRNDRSLEAEAALQLLPDRSTISSENAYFAGSILADRGKKEMAVSALEAALAGDATFPGKQEAEKMLASLNKRK